MSCGPDPQFQPRFVLPPDDQPSEDLTGSSRRASRRARIEPISSARHSLDAAIASTQHWLTAAQTREGYWIGELEGDSILQSETILLLAWLGEHHAPLAAQCGRQLLATQLPTGGWAMYPGGRVEISGSVKAYFALKLTGHAADSEPLQRARYAILAHGGADAVNSFTRFYLALLGQIPFDLCPAVPPEFVLLPNCSPINIYRISAWSRTIFVPLSLVWALRPVRAIPAAQGIAELFLRPANEWPALRSPGRTDPPRWISWERLFRGVDRGLKLLERWRVRPLRKLAMRSAERWMLERFADSDGLGAIYPPIVWSLIALRSLGYPDDSPEVLECRKQLEALILRGPPPASLSAPAPEQSPTSQPAFNGALQPAPQPAPQPCPPQILVPSIALPDSAKTAHDSHNSARLQPCLSPVWDTALALRGLAASGVTRHAASRNDASRNDASRNGASRTDTLRNDALRNNAARSAASRNDDAIERAVDWLLSKEVRRRGDWAERTRAEPGGWFFEHRNAFYPDIDDTIMVAMALRELFDDSPRTTVPLQDSATRSCPTARSKSRSVGLLRALSQVWTTRRSSRAKANPNAPTGTDDAESWLTIERTNRADALSFVARWERVQAATARALDWTLAMQNSDGGWGAFDRNNDAEFLCHVPFADHNAMIDPSTPDITARVLEMLGGYGYRADSPPVAKALRFLRRTQESDGAWFGRWGVNYIYGTWQALVGLRAVGVSLDDPMVQRGRDWLTRCQQPDGGWGESADSYDDPALRGQGPSTASQTAWALLGLIAAGRVHDTAAGRGVAHLLETQRPDGRWDEPQFTGTGFPRVFYLRYHLYPVYFPLLALGTYRRESKQ